MWHATHSWEFGIPVACVLSERAFSPAGGFVTEITNDYYTAAAIIASSVDWEK